ncbi:MAG: hypothetical protein LBL90_08075 [Prevotellaceae bacterium]|jgi:hypothetical protein|nr:hypothetical protein [Prevotellaceae bacterium]
MKKDSVRDFMKAQRQKIDDDGFTAKLAARLEYYPVPQKANRKSFYIALIAPAFFLLAVLAIALLDGWDILIVHLKNNPFDGLNILWPALASLTLLLSSGLTILAINWKETY